MINRLLRPSVLLGLLGAAFTAGCQRDLASQICSSLVSSQDEAICILPTNVAPLSIIGPAVFDAPTNATLRHKLESLPEPSGSSEESGTIWFHFGNNGRFQASCRPTGSNDGVDQCFWHLRSLEAVDAAKLPIVDEARKGGFRDGIIHLATSAMSDGSTEAVTLRVIGQVVKQIDWSDPSATKDFSPPWFRRH